jgi:hypothetical protein
MGHLGRLGISTHSFRRTFATLYDLLFSPLETYIPHLILLNVIRLTIRWNDDE